MKGVIPIKVVFLISVVAGVLLFAVSEPEPWDSPYGWIGMAGLGLVLGFLGRGNPMLWPLGIFLGGALYGTGSLAINLFFHSGGGVNFFFPLGLMFLVPFTIPAVVGSLAGFGLRKALNKPFNSGA